MSNFLKSLFGAKKAAKVTKSKMQTRRLELIGLEERITPAATLALSGAGVLSLTATGSVAENLTVSASGQNLFFSATGVITTTVAGSSGSGTSFVTVDLSNAAYAGALLNLISLNGNATAGAGVNLTTLNVNGNLDLTAVTGTTSIGLTLQDGNAVNDDDANITGLVKTKGAGAVTVEVNNTATSTLFINNLGDITTSTGAVSLTGNSISTGGDVNTTSGAITYTGAVTLNSNVATTSTLAAGNLSVVGALALAGFDFTANQGAGNVTGFSGGVSGIGNLTLTGAVVATGAGVINITGNGELNAKATTGDLTFAAGVTAPTVKATSDLGNVIFSSTVASTVGKIEVSAVTPTKAISIAAGITGANNSNITLTGDVLSNNATLAQLTSNGNGAISIVGKVSAATPSNDFTISGAGAVSISGVVDSTIGDFTVSGTGTLSLGNNITTVDDITLSIAKTILTADVALKTTGSLSGISISGTVDGAKKLTLETPAVSTSTIALTSVGQTTALNTVTVTNSGGVFTGLLTATNVVLTDTVGTIAFGSFGSNPATTISSLTTFVKGYSVSFEGNTVLSGTPVFLNTGAVNFQDDVTLTAGATITGNATSTVLFGDGFGFNGPLIISNGAFNIGALPTTTLEDGTAFVLNSTTAASTFAGKVALGAANDIDLLGLGTLTLSGDSSLTLLGGIDVINGTLNVTGQIGASSVSAANNGTISGAGGTIGVLQVITGTVAPGGTLNTAAVTLNSSTNYNVAVLSSSLAANLKTAAAINLGNAVLQVTSAPAGLAVGASFTIIDNTAAITVPVVGTFAGLAEGADVSGKDVNGNTITYTVSYIGGDGNNVTLKVKSVATATPAPSAPAQPMVPGQPALNKFTAIGSDVGASPTVTITFQNGTFVSFLAYAEAFKGGVRVALGNVDGGTDIELITGAGVGGGPNVKVFKINPTTGAQTLQSNFFAFGGSTFTGGIYVAAGDTNDDGFADVIVGAGATGGPRVSVYAGSATGVVTSSTLNDFFAYASNFTGGVVVAAGQRNAVAGDEVITAPASNGGYHIRSFNCNGTGNSPTLVDNFFAFNNTTSIGGLSLAAGLLNAGTIDDLIIGTSNGGYGVLIDSDTSGIAGVPFAGFNGPIRAGVAENSTGQDFAVALAGPTGGPRVSVFSVGSNSLVEVDNLFVADPAGRTGLFGSSTL